MTRVLYLAKVQALHAKADLTDALNELKSGVSLSTLAESMKDPRQKFLAQAALARWLHRPEPIISHAEKGFYFKYHDNTRSTFLMMSEELGLVRRLQKLGEVFFWRTVPFGSRPCNSSWNLWPGAIAREQAWRGLFSWYRLSQFWQGIRRD